MITALVEVRGPEEAKLLTSFCLPSLLDCGRTTGEGSCLNPIGKLVIVTTRKSLEAIEGTSTFRKLRALIEVTPLLLADQSFVGQSQDDRGIGPNLGLFEDAFRDDAGAESRYLLLRPGFLFADNALAFLDASYRRGTRLVLVDVLPVQQVELRDALRANHIDRGTGAFRVPPRDACQLALRHLHGTHQVFLDGFEGICLRKGRFGFYWNRSVEGLVYRGVGYHPLLFDSAHLSMARWLLGLSMDRPQDRGSGLEIPDGLVGWYVVQDSDELFIADLAPACPLVPLQVGLPPVEISLMLADHPSLGQLTQYASSFHCDRGSDLQARPVDRSRKLFERIWMEGEPLRDQDPVGHTHVRLNTEGTAQGDLRSGFYSRVYLSRLLERPITEWRARGTRIVLYGAGEHTVRLLDCTLLGTANLIGIVDRDPVLQGRRVGGVLVSAPESIAGLRPDVVIISSFAHRQEIFESLSFLDPMGTQRLCLYPGGSSVGEDAGLLVEIKRRGGRIALCGVGLESFEFFRCLVRTGIEIDCFVTENPYGTFLERPVVAPDAVDGGRIDCFLIATPDPAEQNAFWGALLGRGVPPTKIIDYPRIWGAVYRLIEQAMRERLDPHKKTVLFISANETLLKHFGDLGNGLKARGYNVLMTVNRWAFHESRALPEVLCIPHPREIDLSFVDLIVSNFFWSTRGLKTRARLVNFIHTLINDCLPSAGEQWAEFLADQDFVVVSTPDRVTSLRKHVALHGVSGRRPLLVPGGYPKLDDSIRRFALSFADQTPDSLIYAPTFGLYRQYTGDETPATHALDILQILLTSGDERVIYRPHPDTPEAINDQIRVRFLAEPRFSIDRNKYDYLDQYARSKLLVTDFSSTAYTYAFILLRPVVFYSPLEASIPEEEKEIEFFRLRSRIGAVARDLHELGDAVRTLLSEAARWRARIEQVRSETVFHLGSSEEYLLEAVDRISSGSVGEDWIRT